MANTTDMTVANTILNQLGARRFQVMTGAKNFIGETNALSFKLPGGGGFCKDGINFVKITLNAGDTYDILFLRTRGTAIKTVADLKDIYADQLRDVFTDKTGLAVSL